jgi:hypothetical protein
MREKDWWVFKYDFPKDRARYFTERHDGGDARTVQTRTWAMVYSGPYTQQYAYRMVKQLNDRAAVLWELAQ